MWAAGSSPSSRSSRAVPGTNRRRPRGPPPDWADGSTRDSSYAVATSSETGTPVLAAAEANAGRNCEGTGHLGLSVGAVFFTAAGGLAVDVSSRVDSATTASRTRASAPARTLRQATGLRRSGSRRSARARRRERLKLSSISERFRHEDSAATGRDPTLACEPENGGAAAHQGPLVPSWIDGSIRNAGSKGEGNAK